MFLSGVDQSSPWTSEKRHFVLATCIFYHIACDISQAAWCCQGRSWLPQKLSWCGVQGIRNSDPSELRFRPLLWQHFQSYNFDFGRRVTLAETCWDLQNILLWQLQHWCHGLSAGWITGFVFKIPCSVSERKDKSACSLCLSQLSCLSPHGKRFIGRNYV